MKKVLSLLVFISLSFSMYVQAQASISFSDSTNIVPDKLDGFKKATKVELGGTQLALNIMGVDAYKDVNTPKLEKQEILEVVMSGNYVITPYIDEDKTVKVIFFSLATDVQKAKMQKVAGSTKQTESKSELPASKEDMLPKFMVSDINGRTYSTDELKGKVVVINFWFVACKPCVKEIPDLNKLVQDYKSAEVVFLAFALNPSSELKKFIAKNPFQYNIIPDASALANLFAVKAYPTHIIADRNGKIVHSVSGVTDATMPTLKTFIDGLLK